MEANKKIIPVVETRGISFSYDDEPILSDVELKIFKGDFAIIRGSNGVGKSTLLKLILGLLPLHCGEIRIMGQDLAAFSQWNKIGYIPQKATNINEKFPASVEEVVGLNVRKKNGPSPFGGLLGGKSLERKGTSRREIIHKALDRVGMSGYSKRLIGELSGGQQQKVFIAKAIVNDPEVIFLDEPTSGVDLKSTMALNELLADFNKNQGMTVVMVTHEADGFSVPSKRIINLDDRAVTK